MKIAQSGGPPGARRPGAPQGPPKEEQRPEGVGVTASRIAGWA